MKALLNAGADVHARNSLGSSLSELLFFGLEKIREVLHRVYEDTGLWNDRSNLLVLQRGIEGYPAFVRHLELLGLPSRLTRLIRLVFLVHPQILRLRIKDSFMNRIDFPWRQALSELAPDFGWEHKKYMEEIALTKIGGIKASVQNPVGVEGKLDPDGRISYEGDPSKIEKRLMEGLEIASEILKKMDSERISEMPRKVQVRRFGHQLSSCRAGRDRTNSVVNADFASHDVENLLICDNSALPKHGVSLAAGPAMSVGCYGWRRIVANHFS